MNRGDGWSVLGKLPTYAEAEVIKLLLESEGVAVEIAAADPMNPQSGVCVLAETHLLHRAAWVLKNSGISDAELAFLATGELGQGER